MAEQKKPKIDLKARLGKKTVTAPGGSAIPPPVGIPKPPGMGGPMPGAGAAAGPPPKVDASDPYAAIGAEHASKMVAEPKAIKVEMSEEVVAAQKKGRARIITSIVAAAVVTGVIGFAFGSGYQRGKGADVAIEGAQALAKEVDEANVIATELNDVLQEAAEKLGNNEYPEAQITKLGAINIPFEGMNLVGKGIGRYKTETVTLLIKYANRAQAANEQKETIQRLLGGSKQAVTDLLAQKKNPKVRWATYVRGGAHGPMAHMQLLPEPFLVKSDKKTKDEDGKEKAYDWPEEFKIKEGGKEHTLKRYKSGDPSGGEVQMIPVAPDTESSVCPDTTILRLRGQLVEMQKILKGDQTPGQEVEGLLQLGEILGEQLRKIGQPG